MKGVLPHTGSSKTCRTVPRRYGLSPVRRCQPTPSPGDGRRREPVCRSPASSARRAAPRGSSSLHPLSPGRAGFLRVRSGSSVEPSMDRMQVVGQFEEAFVVLKIGDQPLW